MTLAPETPIRIERQWPDDAPTRVPYWVYTDPDLYAAEQEKIFEGPFWSYVGLSCEVPEPGDFLRTHVGERSVVLCRNAGGELRGYLNRCAHRGVQFCRDDRGHTTEWLCPYHQWCYDLDGALLGVPFRRGVNKQGGMPADFSLADHGLQTLAITERHGVVFASFSDAAPPLAEYLGDTMRFYFDRLFDGRPLEVIGYQRQRVPANWKLMFENIKDPYHASLLHVFLVTFGLFRADNPSSVKMDPTGMHAVLCSQRGEQEANETTVDMRAFVEDLALHDPRLLDPVREFPTDETVVMQTVWPNLIVQQQSNTLAVRQLVPRGPQVFDLHWTFFGYADDDDAMRTRRLRQANLMGPAGLVSIDDGEVMALSQAGVATSPEADAAVEMGGLGVTDEDHMVTEAAIRAFYVRYREVMGL